MRASCFAKCIEKILPRKSRGDPLGFVEDGSCPSVFKKTFDSLSTASEDLHMDTPKQPVPVAILVRVSTSKQETTRQLHELQAVAASRGWQVVEVVQETVSGSADREDRTGLQRAEELARSGRIQKLLVHEVSRLARRPSVAHSFVEMLELHCVSLYWHAHSIETSLPNGKRNPAAGIMLALLAEMARAEKDTLRERIASGLAEARRKGVRLGRPRGSTLSQGDLLKKHADIVRLLKSGQSIRNAGKIADKGFSTVQRVKAAMEAAA